MVAFSAVRTDMSEKLMREYRAKLETMEMKDLVKEFFTFLDYTEESDSGRVFHPITFSCCRCLMSEPFSLLLDRMRVMT